MKNEILNRIAISEEVLSAIPKTEPIRYIPEIKKIYSQYNVLKLQIIEEMKQRVKPIDVILSQEDFKYNKYEDILNKLKTLNVINTPYEKMGLDKALYNLKKYYKSNFIEVNNYIFDALDIFKTVGIKLKEEDFFYDEYERLYMKEIISLDRNNYSIESLKNTFETYYWKNPNIISHIHYNFRSIYYKNANIFDKHIKKISKEINQKTDILKNEYKEKIIEQDINYDNNSKKFVSKFVSDELNIKDYSSSNVIKITDSLFESGATDKEKLALNLNKTLNEYKKYLKYQKMIEEIKLEIQNKSKEKIVSSKKLKEIIKIENQLKKSSKKKGTSKEEIIQKIKTLYDEFDEIYFKEKMFLYLNDSSKIINGIEYLVSFYENYINISKKGNSEITIEELDDNLKELEEFIVSPYNTLINNLDIKGEYDISLIIVDKYKLDNIIIDKEALAIDSIDNIISNTELLLNYSKINKLKDVTIDQISDYYKIKKILNK